MTTWVWKKFSELSVEELYQAIELREQVFIVEQNCVYLDCDGYDPKAWHLLGYQNQKLVAYLRAFPAGIKYPEASLGRVVTNIEARRTGAGKELLKVAIEKMNATFSKPSIRISAQAHLQKFYEGFGFRRVSDEYLEDKIPHIAMLVDKIIT